MQNNTIAKLKILIVEDDLTSEILMKEMLDGFDFDILIAIDGREAVDQCQQHPDIDIIFMDIQMPVMNGYLATQKIREFNKEVIIIAQTAYALTGDKERAENSGCNDYISKPIDRNNLIELILKYSGKNN